jgi:hypothetical protein
VSAAPLGDGLELQRVEAGLGEIDRLEDGERHCQDHSVGDDIHGPRTAPCRRPRARLRPDRAAAGPSASASGGRRPALARRLDGVLAWARPGGGAGRIDEARGSGARKVVRVSYVRLKRLFTRIYFADETMNGSDPILALVPPERRHTLMATPDATRGGVFRFEIRLQGQGETVFFDA